MGEFIINSDLTASADIPKPVKSDLSKAEFRDKLKTWENRNKYEIDDSFFGIAKGGKEWIGKIAIGELREGILYITEILKP